MGQGSEVLHAAQHEVVEAQPAQIVEVAGGAVEQAHDDAFAVEGGQRGDAQIHFAAQDFDLDAAILRQAALGDVELGHQLQARDDGGLELARRRLLVEEHAIHAEAYAEFLLEGLDVDVAGAVLNGLPDHGIDQPDDGRLAGHVAQVLEVFVGLRGADFGIEGLLGALAVVLVDGVEDVLFGGQRGFDFQAGEGAYGRDGVEIQRIGHGQREGGVLHGQRNEAALAHEACRESFEFGRRRGRGIDGDERQGELFGERREDVPRRDEAHVDQDLAQLVAAFALQF